MSLYRRNGSPMWYMNVRVKGQRINKSTGQTDKRLAMKVKAETLENLKSESYGMVWLIWLQDDKENSVLDAVFSSKKKVKEHLDLLDGRFPYRIERWGIDEPRSNASFTDDDYWLLD